MLTTRGYQRLLPHPRSCTLVASKSLPQQTTLPSVRSAANAPQLADRAQPGADRAAVAAAAGAAPGDDVTVLGRNTVL